MSDQPSNSQILLQSLIRVHPWQVQPHPRNPRFNAPDAAVDTLGESIKVIGQTTPIKVRHPTEAEQKQFPEKQWICLGGHMRLLAGLKAKMEWLFATVVETEPTQDMKQMLADNLTRNLHWTQRAWGVSEYSKDCPDVSQAQIAAEVGMTRTAVSEALKMTERFGRPLLEEIFAHSLQSKDDESPYDMPLKGAVLLSDVRDPSKREGAVREALGKELTTQQIRELVSAIETGAAPAKAEGQVVAAAPGKTDGKVARSAPPEKADPASITDEAAARRPPKDAKPTTPDGIKMHDALEAAAKAQGDFAYHLTEHPEERLGVTLEGKFFRILDAMHHVVRGLVPDPATATPPSFQKAQADAHARGVALRAEMEALKKSDPKAAAEKEKELIAALQAIGEAGKATGDALKARADEQNKAVQALKDAAAKLKK
jgi:ParB-like chromosome segregation protein Spo0J